MKTNSKINLPRGYVSWSSLDLLERDEYGWVQKYCNPDYIDRTTIEMDFGKDFASFMELDETDDEIAKLVKATIPKYDLPEKEIRATLRALGREVELLGKPDSLESVTWDFLEYKTGKTKWTKEKAQKHGQLIFYKVIIYILTGKLISSKLIWIPTGDIYDEEDVRRIAFTGQMPLCFPVEHTMADLLKMMNRIIKGAERMEFLYQQEINKVFN